MMSVRRLVERLAGRWATAAAPRVAPGVYHYQRESGGTYTRFHLRVDPSGHGLLLANATAAARLRPSGITIAKGLLDGLDEAAIAAGLKARFAGAAEADLQRDIDEVRRVITTLDSPGDNYPILNLDDPTFTAGAAAGDPPLAADVPFAEPQRLRPLLDRLWDLGIPHVTFLVGENPDAGALVHLVEHAEDLGMISGVRGRGSDLARGTLIGDLAQAGVDHVNVLYLSARNDVHNALAGGADHQKAVQALKEIHKSEVCPVAELALTRTTLATLEETLGALAALGVTNVCFFGVLATDEATAREALSEQELLHASERVEDAALKDNVRYLWYPPVKHYPTLPLARLVRRGSRCSGDRSVRVEPDGSIIPARGPFEPIGNVFRERIWP